MRGPGQGCGPQGLLSFEGLVRAVDLDARRFEIRGIGSSRGIRCIYEPNYDQLVGGMLDAAVLVTGHYEAAPDQQPRLGLGLEMPPQQ